jgi:hypothetical protein
MEIPALGYMGVGASNIDEWNHDHSGPAPERYGDVILSEVAVRVHVGIRLGRQDSYTRQLDADRGHGREAQPVGT